MLVELAQQVGGLRLRPGKARFRAVPIDEVFALGDPFAHAIAGPESYGAIQRVVGMETQCAFAGTVLDGVTRGVHDRATNSGVDVLDPKTSVGEVVSIGEGRSIEGVDDCQQIPADVICRTHPYFHDWRQLPSRRRRITIALDHQHYTAQRIDGHTRRRIPTMPVAGGCDWVCAAGVIIGIVRVSLPRRRLEDIRVTEIRRGDAPRHSKDDPLFRAVRIHSANEMTARLIEHFYLLPELRIGRLPVVIAGGVKRLVLFHHPALVVVGLPAAHDHIRRLAGISPTPDDVGPRTCLIRLIGGDNSPAENWISKENVFSLSPGLQHAAETIGILAVLDGFITLW